MNISVNGKTIETDAAGFLKNPDDWNEEVAEVLAKEHEKAGHKPLNETAMGLLRIRRREPILSSEIGGFAPGGREQAITTLSGHQGAVQNT